MPNPKMLILRGNSAPAGNYPDESGNANVAWPLGALHVQAASDYARMRGYDPVVLDEPGQPQSQHSPQATAAIRAFLEDGDVAAFYGFSGGGYNVKHILDFLASNNPETLHRIALVVVIGSPARDGSSTKPLYLPSAYNAVVKGRTSTGMKMRTGRWSTELTQFTRNCPSPCNASARTCLARIFS